MNTILNWSGLQLMVDWIILPFKEVILSNLILMEFLLLFFEHLELILLSHLFLLLQQLTFVQNLALKVLNRLVHIRIQQLVLNAPLHNLLDQS